MLSLCTLVLIAIPCFLIYSNISSLFKNITAAKRSGLPYVISPVNLYNPLWMLTHKLWLPILAQLPKSWTRSWIDYLTPDWVWERLHTPWETNGETFLTVSPGLINVWVTNAEAIHQITSRREAFPKPLAAYKILEIFGRNIISTEGAEWKQHRKITSPSFNEKNNALVFAEACGQAQGMLRKWTANNLKEYKTNHGVAEDTMRLTLHIISRIGFGIRLLWPGEVPKENSGSRNTYSSDDAPQGHSLSFVNALSTLLEQLLWVLLTPKPLLRRLPFKSAHRAYEAWDNWSRYMNELFSRKIDEARNGEYAEGMDIMGSLVKNAYGQSTGKDSSSEKGSIDKPVLSDADVLGNAFVMIIAGHETTANAIHFCLMELAINPKSQLQVQKDIQTIFGNSAPHTWDYDSSINKLLGGIVGAVLNEQLRLMPPIIAIPKTVPKNNDQEIMIDGKKITLPAGAHINLVTIGLHRNPRYWPSGQPTHSNRPDDLDEFKPERWLVETHANNKQPNNSSGESEEDDDFGGFTGKASHKKLFHPARGSYLPFSEGPRSCLGRRLAQVKIMAVLAVIFQQFSIELAVDEWASDDEVAAMPTSEKRKIYKVAQDKARATLRTATSLITLKLHSGSIPVRLVKKGEERFLDNID